MQPYQAAGHGNARLAVPVLWYCLSQVPGVPGEDSPGRGTPNIGTLMFTPYLRVVPMHLTIVFGAVAMGATGVLVFGGMKLVAGVMMHLAEHRLLSRRTGH